MASHPPPHRRDVEFDSAGTTCRAWFYAPEASGARPCIVMAHGLGGTRDAGLEPYAEAFRAAGYGVLLFDYRHFGASDGEPRQLLSVPRQLDDWAAAIACARRLPGVDAGRIALWGSSFSGGHVIVAAARDGRIAAVSAQGPMMDGRAAVLNLLRYAGVGTLLRLSAAGLRDQLGAWLGRAPVYVPLIAPPGGFAAMSSADAESGYRAIVPPGWRNQMSARLALQLPLYRPDHRRRARALSGADRRLPARFGRPGRRGDRAGGQARPARRTEAVRLRTLRHLRRRRFRAVVAGSARILPPHARLKTARLQSSR